MRFVGRLSTETFRSRCTDCPDRGIGTRVLASMVLGPDYRPDNCEGPEIVRGGNTGMIGGIFGDDFRFVAALLDLARVCGQDTRTITGEFVEVAPPKEPPPPEIII